MDEKADTEHFPAIIDKGEILLLRPAEQIAVNAPSTVTPGTTQVRQVWSPLYLTSLFVHLMLALEQQARPE